MKDQLRQMAVIVTILATLVINGLATSLPLNGLTTGQISDRFKVYFVRRAMCFPSGG